ncbi:Hsp33 family molecular chaperone HslO [Pusillimonas sp. CC-YST705]|uniref:Hsp33 family molecular chaperone HslO n=1 Tax=Mesopusillimonas faecipullorum TaxID=2755040 RepID=A0ABS8C9K2_9BURK|nr:Hsp33 family molecular chaperone HslO [Mesopusillimonas faecipullorum]MCB5362524.1 Hsp33 family molecular chaperone HslO [Mesopusillimonas faecipullorum]
MSDFLQKLLSADRSTRIQIVSLEQSWQTGLAHQHYPECVRNLLGELVSAAVLLTSNIKFEGSLILQLQGDGPVALIVVECDSELNIRATATLREGQPIPEDGNLQQLMNAQNQGRFSVILDPRRSDSNMSTYQGIVPLEGDTVAEVLQAYMHHSEQLDTRLWLAADGQRCAGLLLQRLPREGGHAQLDDTVDQDDWDHLLALTSTLTPDELRQLDAQALLHRLYWNESLTAFEPQGVRWWCPCTRDRVANMLRMLGKHELEDLLTERQQIDVSCNFCGKPYRFDAIDCTQLFLDAQDTPPSSSSPQ